MRTGKRLVAPALLTLLLVAWVPGAHAQSFEGTWHGLTGQNQPISFVVFEGVITELHLEGNVVGDGCSGTFRLTQPVAVPLVDGGFTTADRVSFISYTLEGTFQSEGLATGTLLFAISSGCPGSGKTLWSASRDGVPPLPDSAAPLATAEVHCDALRLRDMARRISATAPNNGKPVGLNLAFTRSGDFAGVAYTGNGPATPEHLLSFSTNPEETSLLRNPERPQLFSLSATRNDLASDLVAEGGEDRLLVVVNPTLSDDPPTSGLLTIDNVRPPRGVSASAKPGRGLASLLDPCHSKLSNDDVHVLRLLSRIARARVEGAASYELALFRGEAPGTYRIDAYPYTADGSPLGRLSAVLEVTRDGTGNLDLGLLRLLGPCEFSDVLTCTDLDAPGILQLVRPVPAGSFWEESPWAVFAPGAPSGAVEIDWSDLLEGTSWRSP